MLAQGHFHTAGGQVHLLTAIDCAQALGLVVTGLAGGCTLDGAVSDLTGGLIDAVVPGLNGSEPCVEC
ncbi:hypothetical protein D3C80_671970 [compost metagenome]